MLELVVPQHVVRGQNIKLECNFNLDGETLYSVKWYKDGNEFYRYVPQNMPPVLVFQLPGVTANVRITLYWFLPRLVPMHPSPSLFYLKRIASHFYRVLSPAFLFNLAHFRPTNFSSGLHHVRPTKFGREQCPAVSRDCTCSLGLRIFLLQEKLGSANFLSAS